MNGSLNDEEAIRARRRRRIEQMRQSKRKQMMYRRYFKKSAPLAAGILVLLVLISGGIRIFHKSPDAKEADIWEADLPDSKTKFHSLLDISSALELLKEVRPPRVYTADTTADTLQLGLALASGENFFSNYAVLIDLESDSILAEKNLKTRINPASMTKVLTVLVAAEHIENLDDTFTITREIADYSYINDCSSAGFEKGEAVSIRDLFYGTVLPSGADGAVGLATYVAKDQETFVELMNEKLDELGLAQTAHFTNCVGIYDENHYCTVYDMAMIMEAAMDNELCREVLSAHTYTTSKTDLHPEGILLSNWFLRRIEDKDCNGEVMCGKTGYVAQSGSCAASYAVDDDGKGYICVTADANSPSRCIADHARLYKQFLETQEHSEG